MEIFPLEVIMLLAHLGDRNNLYWTRRLPLIPHPYSCSLTAFIDVLCSYQCFTSAYQGSHKQLPFL